MTIQEAIAVLSQIEQRLTNFDFGLIFGVELGEYLWRKFEANDYSLTRLYQALDLASRKKLAHYIETL